MKVILVHTHNAHTFAQAHCALWIHVYGSIHCRHRLPQGVRVLCVVMLHLLCAFATLKREAVWQSDNLVVVQYSLFKLRAPAALKIPSLDMTW